MRRKKKQQVSQSKKTTIQARKKKTKSFSFPFLSTTRTEPLALRLGGETNAAEMEPFDGTLRREEDGRITKFKRWESSQPINKANMQAFD